MIVVCPSIIVIPVEIHNIRLFLGFYFHLEPREVSGMKQVIDRASSSSSGAACGRARNPELLFAPHE